MPTLSISLPPDLDKVVRELSKQKSLSKAEIVRQAIRLMAEEEAVDAVLKARQELVEGKVVYGDLKKLVQ